MESTPIELEIRGILDQGPNLEAAIDLITNRIIAIETTDAERFAYWIFLFHAGYYHEVLTTLMHRLVERSRIHWGVLIETAALFNVVPGSTVMAATVKGIKRQSGTEDLWGAHSWDDRDPRLQELRQTVRAGHDKKEKDRQDGLIEKFYFLQGQRMRDQAGRVLKRLIFLYPTDPRFHELQSAFDEEWAREVISNRYGMESEHHRPAEVSKEEIALLSVWTKECEKLCDGKPAAAYDFAIGFLLVGADTPADQFAVLGPQGNATDWLVAELMLRLRRYVDLLEHLHTVEMRYLTDPETAFGVAYLRAQALRELGQSAAAVEILRDIVQVRPTYRSANHLIMEWSQGAATG